MKADNTSLDNLRDIVELAPVSWWPLATGWWVIIGIFAIAISYFLIREIRKWHANAYRRAAIQALQQAENVTDVAEILKRTALCAFPRSNVASLSGTSWCHWLGRTIEQEILPPIAESLTRSIFNDSSLTEIESLREFTEQWIKNHQVVRSTDSEPENLKYQESGVQTIQ